MYWGQYGTLIIIMQAIGLLFAVDKTLILIS